MVSMYVDIRQAAELLAKVTGTNPIYQAQQISLAGQFHGLEFRGPGKSLWEWRPGMFTTATGEDGKVYVRPAGAYKGERRKALQAIRGEAETDEADDNELVTPYFTVSIADIVTNPFFRFDAEIQEQILEAHKAAIVGSTPAFSLRRIVAALEANKAAQASPEQAPEPAHPATPDTRRHDGLPTPDIAELFDGAPYTKDEWKKRINERAWLVNARIAKGAKGGAPAMWCPLTIGQLVWEKYRHKRTQLKKAFKENPVLAPWRDDWDQFIDRFSNDD